MVLTAGATGAGVGFKTTGFTFVTAKGRQQRFITMLIEKHQKQ
jgi:hypothetical protein